MIYVAYEDGVYRHKTIAFSVELEDLTSKILDYFKSTDGYHTVSVELLDLNNQEIIDVCSYTQSITYRYYNKLSGFGQGRMRAIDGKCVVYKDGTVFHEYIQSHELKDEEEWCE